MSEPSAESLVHAREYFLANDIPMDGLERRVTRLAGLLDAIDAKAREEERERAAFIASTLAIPPCPDDVTFASIYLHVADIAKTIRRAPTDPTHGDVGP
jgi:hypothetical protein